MQCLYVQKRDNTKLTIGVRGLNNIKLYIILINVNIIAKTFRALFSRHRLKCFTHINALIPLTLWVRYFADEEIKAKKLRHRI